MQFFKRSWESIEYGPFLSWCLYFSTMKMGGSGMHETWSVTPDPEKGIKKYNDACQVKRNCQNKSHIIEVDKGAVIM